MANRVDFAPRVRLEFRGTQLSSDGGLMVMRELDDALGLSQLASGALRDIRIGKNTAHRPDGQFRQSVYGRLAGYEDVNDADRLALDPVMRQIVGGYQKANSFIADIRQVYDDMPHWYHKKGQRIDATADRLAALHLYDSIAVLEKQRVLRPSHSLVGTAIKTEEQ